MSWASHGDALHKERDSLYEPAKKTPLQRRLRSVPRYSSYRGSSSGRSSVRFSDEDGKSTTKLSVAPAKQSENVENAPTNSVRKNRPVAQSHKPEAPPPLPALRRRCSERVTQKLKSLLESGVTQAANSPPVADEKEMAARDEKEQLVTEDKGEECGGTTLPPKEPESGPAEQQEEDENFVALELSFADKLRMNFSYVSNMSGEWEHQERQESLAGTVRLDRDSEEHEVYGQLLLDLGFKRVFAAQPHVLCNTLAAWHKQRPCNMARVKEISEHLKRSNMSLPGAISIFDFEDARPRADIIQIRGVFDGQHRLEAIRLLLTEEFSSERRIIVEVYPVTSELEIKQWFLLINKAESVQEIDLPDQLAPDIKTWINGAVDRLEVMFPEMFKPSIKCKVPHVNRDKLRNLIFQEGLVRESGVQSAEQLLELLLEKNRELSLSRDWPPKHRGKNMLQKAKRNNFFLGMTDTWAVHVQQEGSASEARQHKEEEEEEEEEEKSVHPERG